MFFAVQPYLAVLADNNPDLINCYIEVRDHPDNIIERLNFLPNTKEDYFRIRHDVPTNNIEKAARLIYLTSLSFNGIHRLNSKGEFNVPYGNKTHLRPCDPDKIKAASLALSDANILYADFEMVVSSAEKGDLVYLDPPYTVAHGNNGFLKYNAKIFSWNDQKRLSKLAMELSQRGCKVIVSNANHPSIIELYKGFSMHIIERSSVMAASTKFRRQITECIFFNEVD